MNILILMRMTSTINYECAKYKYPITLIDFQHSQKVIFVRQNVPKMVTSTAKYSIPRFKSNAYANETLAAYGREGWYICCSNSFVSIKRILSVKMVNIFPSPT